MVRRASTLCGWALRSVVVSATLELWSYRSLAVNLAGRELKAKYKRSVLGWLWSLINPAATIGIYTLVFSVILRVQPPVAGNGSLENFALYLFVALVFWSYFQTSIQGSMGALAGAGPLRTKVYFPVEIPILSSMAAGLTQTGVELGILVVIMLVVGNISWTVLLVPLLLALLIAFTLGLALIVGLANVYYRDVGYLVGIVLNFVFYLTPIVYTLEIVPDDYYVFGISARSIIGYNPMAMFVAAARDLLYGLESPTLFEWGRLGLLSGASLVLGWIGFQRWSGDVVEEL